MTVEHLRELVALTKDEHGSLRIVRRDDFYDRSSLPTDTQIGYVCCAMGDCSWSDTPKPHYDRVLFWDERW